MPNGSVVKVEAVSGGWLKTTWQGVHGWCSATYVEVAGIDGPKLGALPGVEVVEPLGDVSDGFTAWKVRSAGDPREVLHQRASADGFRLRALERRMPTLEEAFIGLVGGEA